MTTQHNHDNIYAKIGEGGVTDHGALTGLSDDDHPQYVKHDLATAVSDFLVASGAGAFVKKTLAEVKTLLGLGSAAYTDSSTFWRKAETVSYASSAGNADTVDNYHAASIYRTDAPNVVILSAPKEMGATQMPVGNNAHYINTASDGVVPVSAKAIIARWGASFSVMDASWYAIGPDSNPASSELVSVMRSGVGLSGTFVEGLAFITVRNGYIFTRYNSSLPTGFFMWVIGYVM